MEQGRSGVAVAVPAPRTVDFLLTYECTSRCAYCFIGQRGASLTMSLPVADRALDWIALAAQGPVEVVLLGGEPTLQPLLIRRVVRRAREWEQRRPVRFSFAMTTNAVPLEEELAARLAEWGVHYMISVGGYGERHDASRPVPGVASPFALLQAKMPKLKRRQSQVAARVTATPATVPYLAEDLAGLTAMGFTYFIVAPASGVAWPDEALEGFVAGTAAFAATRGKRDGRPFPVLSPCDDAPEGKGTWGCGAGRGRYAIDPEGGLYTCARFAGLSGPASLRLGDVYRGVESPEALRALQDTSSESRPECRECELRDKCVGGCPAINMSYRGSVVRPHPDECRFNRAVDEIRRRVFGPN